tara:strand:- start:9 stop:155 length:147 start_codon:yes stop_codon:yes gene_type:complete
MENCPKQSMNNLNNILNYNLSIKDVMAINKIISKKTLTIIEKNKSIVI